MLAAGNRKLGHLVHSFSIPARHTCPGATAACLAVCYAKRGHFMWGRTQQTHQRNWERSLGDDFVAEIVAEVLAKRVAILRVHVAGDFYSAPYIRKWIEIAKRCKRTTLFAYTRSWRIRNMVPALRAFTNLPNVRLWLSADRNSGLPPTWPDTRIAYMLDEVANEPGTPEYADLVFRVKRRGVKKYDNGHLVCPPEQGVTRESHIGCSECKLCFSDRPIPQKLLQIGV